MSRTKLGPWAYFNWQLPPERKESLQLLARDKHVPLSTLLLKYDDIMELLRTVAQRKGQVQVTDNEDGSITVKAGKESIRL